MKSNNAPKIQWCENTTKKNIYFLWEWKSVNFTIIFVSFSVTQFMHFWETRKSSDKREFLECNKWWRHVFQKFLSDQNIIKIWRNCDIMEKIILIRCRDPITRSFHFLYCLVFKLFNWKFYIDQSVKNKFDSSKTTAHCSIIYDIKIIMIKALFLNN